MNTRRSFLSALSATALFALTATLATATTPQDSATKGPVAKIGEAAPNFTLSDTAGKEVKLSDHKGKIVVLQWINPGCPVCRRVTEGGIVANMMKEAKALDENVVHIAIDSTSFLDKEKTTAYLKSHKIRTGLFDQDGKVGKLYGAKTTPHMFVIDAEGILRYNGAIDNDRSGKADDRVNYVVNAIRQIKAGETVSPDQSRPYGCSVKYAKKK